MFCLGYHIPIKQFCPDGAAYWTLLFTWFSTSLMRSQFPVFLLPRLHCCSRVHMATHLLHSSGSSQMTRHCQQGRRPVNPELALFSDHSISSHNFLNYLIYNSFHMISLKFCALWLNLFLLAYNPVFQTRRPQSQSYLVLKTDIFYLNCTKDESNKALTFWISPIL